MGQVETKVFVDAPPWDLEELDKITDLEKSTVNLLWRKWATDPATKKGKVKFETFASELCVNLEDEKEVEQAQKVFNLIDEDDDGHVEFPDIMLFLFCLDDQVFIRIYKIKLHFIMVKKGSS